MSKAQLETRKSPTSASKNIASLLFCFLLIVSICLTAFNFYLFAWIWSNFSGGNPLGFGPIQMAAQNRAPSLMSAMKIMRQQDDNVIRINAKLISDKWLMFARVEGVESGDQLDGQSSALRFTSKSEIRLGEPANQNPNGKSSAGLIASGQRGSLSFPNGLIVRDRDTLRPLINCSSAQEAGKVCHLRSPTVKLAAKRVDFANKSIQLPRLQVRRLHSPMNKLQLMCTNQTRLSSRDKQIDFQALDTISLGSRHSKVIIKAQTIDLGDKLIDTRARGQARRDGYKLCICLDSSSSEPKRCRSNKERRQTPMDAREKLGRVFAVRDQLECSHLARFCNRAARSEQRPAAAANQAT